MRIFVSKSVCKTWNDIVSHPEFAKLHFNQGEIYPLIRIYGSKMVHLMQPNNGEVEIEARFEVPNLFDIVTCNGLLCLSGVSDKELPIVCNPITGEFINLPDDKKINSSSDVLCYGFGFSPTTNQYKIIRMSERGTPGGNMAEVNILGTNTWKNIGFFTLSLPMSSPIYLYGFLYWRSYLGSLSLLTFDVEKEHFESVSLPTLNQPYQYDNVGVLGGELCICEVLDSGAIHVWTMKDNGTKKAWSKVFSLNHIYYDPIQHYGSLQPIKYLNDGALLMFNSCEDTLVYIEPKQNRLRSLRFCPFKVEAIAYIPTFVSLKHALSGHDVKVLNMRSRGAKLKLPKEDNS
ncbi:putative F-box protein At3g23260 [Euphorbia lathyris]|uniref:putative F-box protein At3g23260 n=1 Tax=Euphorbia lathyris TaxID=212925 RepID=UPI0033131199